MHTNTYSVHTDIYEACICTLIMYIYGHGALLPSMQDSKKKGKSGKGKDEQKNGKSKQEQKKRKEKAEKKRKTKKDKKEKEKDTKEEQGQSDDGAELKKDALKKAKKVPFKGFVCVCAPGNVLDLWATKQT